MLNAKIIIWNRLRDISAIINCNFKIRAFIFILLRTIIRPLSIDEKYIAKILPNGISKFNQTFFFTRRQTLDFIFLSDWYERETTRFLQSQHYDKFVVVGSHIGRFAIGMRDIADHVFAYEPDRDNYNILLANKILNNATAVNVYNTAVGGEHGWCQMHIDTNTSINTGKKLVKMDSIANKESVEVFSLDTILKEHDVTSDSLILLDAEGYEFEIINNSKNLQLIKPWIILESFDIEKLVSHIKYLKICKVLDSYNYLIRVC